MSLLSLSQQCRVLGLGLGLSALTPLSGCSDPAQSSSTPDNGTPIAIITPQPPAAALDPCGGADAGVGCEAEKVLPTLFKLQLTAQGLAYQAPDTMPSEPQNVVRSLQAEQARLFLTIDRSRFNSVEENGVIRFPALAKWSSDPGPTNDTFTDISINLRKSGASLCDMGYEPLYNGLDATLGYPFRDIGTDPFFFCQQDAARIGLFYAVEGVYNSNTDILEFTLRNTRGDTPSDVTQASQLCAFEFYGPEDLGFPQFNGADLPSNSALLVYGPRNMTFNVSGLFSDITTVDEPVAIDSEAVELCSGSACDDLGKQLVDQNADNSFVGGATAASITAQLTSVTISPSGETIVESGVADAGTSVAVPVGDGGL